MGWWGWLRRRLDVLLRKSTVEDELDDEMRFHVDMQIREHMASGLTESEARRRALVEFGGVERYKEEVRDVRGARILDDWIQDTRVALRSFAKEPAFLVAVLGTLALGIGGNVAMLGIFDAALLRSLPYPDAGRLVMGRVTYEGRVGNTVSGPDYFDYREQSTSLASLGAYTPFEIAATVTGVGDAERVSAPLASTNLFRTLGVVPVLGRDFTDEEGEPGAESVAILTHAYWERRFGSDPRVVGSTLSVDGAPTTVVGVLPASFHFPVTADLWRPMQRGGPYAGARQFHNWVLIGRLAPSIAVSAAQAEVDAISARLATLYPDSNRDKGMALTPLREALAERSKASVVMLAAAMALLLLVACANVGGVLLARGSARGTELAIRASLGAGGGRLLRQFLAEGALLVVCATALGVTIAGWLQRTILAFVTVNGVDPGLSLPAILAAMLVAIVTVAAFGALPAAKRARTVGATELRGRSGSTGGLVATRFRGFLVVAQVTLTVVLLVMSGLLVRSLSRLYGVDTGFDADGLLTAGVQLPPGAYQGAQTRTLFYDQLLQAVTARPDVEAAALIDRLPVRDSGGNVRVGLPGEFGESGVFGRLAYQRMVMPGYFDAMGIPIRAGRDVTLDDDRNVPNVMILSEALARDIFGEQNPLGQRLRVDVGDTDPWIAEVVGVVGDVVPSNLAEGTDYAMYFSYAQRSPASMRLALRTAGDPSAIAGALRAELRTLDPDVPLSDLAWMSDVIRDSVSGRRAVMLLLGIFAGVALLLAAVGLYGVLAYQVATRTHEIGVRMALGSSVAGVVESVMRSGFVLVGIGLVLGMPASWLATRLVQSLLFEVSPTDPLTYLAVGGFLAIVSALACVLPARRAARVDPVTAFRAE